MKIFAIFFVATLGLAQARSLEQSSGKISSVTILNGSLSQEVDAYVNAWILESKTILSLPVNKSQLVNVNYVEYTTPAFKNHTKSPYFGITAPIPIQSTDQSYLALEIYNNATSPATYIGGRIATVAEVKQLPHSYQLELLDQAGKNSGVVTISWI